MYSRLRRQALCCGLLGGAAWVSLAATPAHGQYPYYAGATPAYYQPAAYPGYPMRFGPPSAPYAAYPQYPYYAAQRPNYPQQMMYPVQQAAYPPGYVPCAPPPVMYPPAQAPCPLPPGPAPAAPGAQQPPVTSPEAPRQPETTPGQAPGTAPQAQAAPQAPSEPSLDVAQSAAVGGESVALASPTMLGDQLGMTGLRCIPVTRLVTTPFSRTVTLSNTTQQVGAFTVNTVTTQTTTGPGTTSLVTTQDCVTVPSAVHTFKIAENESPRPLDRIFLNFNYFNDVDGDANRALGADIGRIDAYRETLGFEKTFFDGNASFGMRLPLNSLDIGDGSLPGTGGGSTDLGDLTMILKYALYNPGTTGNLFSVGLAITAPTGPSSFAGIDGGMVPFHETLLQPFVGYIATMGRLYVHGFSAIDVPTDTNDATFLYNDIGLGLYAYRSSCGDRILTALVPTAELHVVNPLTHSELYTPVGGRPDIVNLTAGLIAEFYDQATVQVGYVQPITDFKPFRYEFLLEFNWRFGCRSRGATPTVVGG